MLSQLVACVSTPEAPKSSTQVDEPTTQNSTASEKGEGPVGNPVPETTPPFTQDMSEQSQSLSEPPVLFPEVSATPIQPGSTRKNPAIVLPVPETPAADSTTGTTATKTTGTASGSQTATVQKNTSAGAAAGTATGSATSADKKSTPVDPKTLKAPEPQAETKVVQEQLTMPVGGIPELPSKTNPALVEEQVVLSRSVRATVGQLVEIPYQGAGWVYLGEVAGKKGLAYDSRRLDPDGQTFVFRCEAPGTYTVKFFKQDFIKDYIINDYVEVVVGESPMPSSSVTGAFSLPVDRGRVVANPRWPTPVSTAAANPAAPVTAPAPTGATSAASTPLSATAGSGGSASSAGTATAAAAPTAAPAAVAPASSAGGGNTQTSPSPAAASQSGSTEPAVESLSQPEDFINLAKKEITAGQYTAALSTLQAFTAKYPAGSDEAWWLYGQILEAKGPQRDIKGALAYYRRLVNEYPQSQRYDEAQQRIAYLERFYFDIR